LPAAFNNRGAYNFTSIFAVPATVPAKKDKKYPYPEFITQYQNYLSCIRNGDFFVQKKGENYFFLHKNDVILLL
jgi:hypothetical protein